MSQGHYIRTAATKAKYRKSATKRWAKPSFKKKQQKFMKKVWEDNKVERITIHCKFCGKPRLVLPDPIKLPKFCNEVCYQNYGMEEEVRKKIGDAIYKGGYTVRTDGYVLINLREGRILEHRHVVEEVLHRHLLPGETIHHINFDRADNRRENLYIFPTAGKHIKYHNTKGEKKTLISNL